MTLCASSLSPTRYWAHGPSFLFHEMERASSAADPLEFPLPLIEKAVLEKISVTDHRTRLATPIKPVIIHQYCPKRRLLNDEDRAYLLHKKIAKTAYGSVYVCIVLRKQEVNEGKTTQWETTEELVAIKISSLERIRAARGKSMEDPIKEASALQFVGNYHSNILGCREVLQTDGYLMVVMDYCRKGNMYTRLLGSSSKSSTKATKKKPGEALARVWFQQLLQCLVHLENKGICHGDICLENLLIDDDSHALHLIDFGTALRIPYVDQRDDGGVVDASEGSVRRLIRNKGRNGKLTYLAPELVDKMDEFDGFAVDLWSAGIILFIMLVGKAPFAVASTSDYRFNEISKGRLSNIINRSDLKISPEACNLLQNMLWRKPDKRLNLSQVLMHPWVSGCSKPPPYPHYHPTEGESHRAVDKSRGEKSEADKRRRYLSPQGSSS
ncbi:hypothetical protein FisN_1Hh158 [Fistulifera solaris]|uniref:Protein kinase domain-containing protein n=1 Tax=Fistulifera solaris TaxID=1519565 RepID=A0A1Z5JE22_FISSO|nr:hypothetical protein FisN_1Hh158 [Fistulifera solaris]|eukprot:GAX12229.1 hypothetical protein FisN_1Hh158 [Fistulifera solaris]